MDQPLTILIADDHPIFRRGLCDVMATRPDLRLVGQAGDGREALQMIADLRPALAILDVHMPKLSGLQVARQLLQEGAATKVLLLTMMEEEDLLNEAINLGIQGYVLKESAVTDLLSAVQAVAEGRTFISPKLSDLLLHRRQEQLALRDRKPGLDQLTPRERLILKLIAEDKTTKEIAQLLHCAVRTVDTHRQNISFKLNLTGSHSLLKFAFDNKSRL